MRRRISCAAAFFLFAAGVPSTTRADGIVVSAGITLNALDGVHDTGTSIARLNFVPLPLAEIDARYHGTSIHLEGLPPLTFSYGSGIGGRQSTRLSIINITARKSFNGGAFIGIGQTIYNQNTAAIPVAPSAILNQGSRVTGARFEAGITHRGFGTTHVEYMFAVNPVMHGVEKTNVRTFFGDREIDDPERAVQVDTSLRFVTPLRHGDIIFGIRYLNYASRFDLRGTTADGLLADRNVGYMPTIGYRMRL